MSRADAARASSDNGPARSVAVRAAASRFDVPVRARVEALALAHAYMNDITEAFPAAMHAIAGGYPTPRKAAEGENLARAGAPLRFIAAALDLPMWLRNLPPEAFSGPIPRLPKTDEFALRIANFRPAKVTEAKRWLNFVAFSYDACDEEFALWAAQRMPDLHQDVAAQDLAGLALLAWYSARPQHEASTFIRKIWNSQVDPADAVTNAQIWLERLEFPLYGAPYAALPKEGSEIDGFEFVPLLTAHEMLTEAEEMRNCLATYAETTASGHHQIWSMRRAGERVACLHVHFESDTSGVPMLRQIAGRCNFPVPADVLRTAYRWLLTWPADRADLDRLCRATSIDGASYRRLMKPFWLAKGLPSWLPLETTRGHFAAVHAGLVNIANPRQARRRGRARHRRRR